MRIRLLGVALCLGLLLPMEARSKSFWVDAAATFSRPSATGIPATMDFQSQMALPGGGFGFELGKFAFDFQYLPRAFYDGFNEMRFNMVQGSTLFRLWLSPMVGISLGGYVSYGLSATRNGAEYSYADYGLKTLDAGGVAGLILQLPAKFFIEGRVTHSALNTATSAGQTFRNMDFIVLTGFRFGGSGRRR